LHEAKKKKNRDERASKRLNVASQVRGEEKENKMNLPKGKARQGKARQR
jgi:hypothetical protein